MPNRGFGAAPLIVFAAIGVLVGACAYVFTESAKPAAPAPAPPPAPQPPAPAPAPPAADPADPGTSYG